MEETRVIDNSASAAVSATSSPPDEGRGSFCLIANPTYDVVFKYLMEDNDIAKLMVSSIIGEEVVTLDPRPHEYTVENVKVGKDTLTVYRLDFSAKIKVGEDYKLVLIEMQKATVVNDIMRFRGYLGRQLANVNNVVIDKEDGAISPLQI
jgi:hypothetical protein